MDDIVRYIGRSSLSLSEAMQRIEQNSCGILFLTDDDGVLTGCITDGDVRRYLLAGGSMSATVFEAANKRPRKAMSLEEAKALYHRKNYVMIPVVNRCGIIIDIYNGEEGELYKKKKKALHLPVVINAGGKGTRLDPYTRVLPKPLIPVGDFPIIELIMKEYQSYGCDEFHIIVNYKRDLIKAYFHDSGEEYRITWHDEERPLGTGGGLRLLRGKLESTFFFVNCDSLLTANYESMLRFHRENGNVVTMACAYMNMDIPYGVVEMGENGLITNIREKPLMSFLTNTGIYIAEPEIIEDIQDGEAIGFPDIIKREKDRGKKVAVFPVSESEWMDMGQLPELEKMRSRLYGN